MLDPENLATAGERAKWLRETTGMSQRQLAGIFKSKSVAHVSLIEGRDGKRLNASTAEAYCRVFGVLMGWLLRGEGERPKEEAVRIAAARAQGARDAETALEKKTKADAANQGAQ